jgi:hypothetical protein
MCFSLPYCPHSPSTPWLLKTTNSPRHLRPDPRDQARFLCLKTHAISVDVVVALHSPIHAFARSPSPGSRLRTVTVTRWEQFFTYSAAATTHIPQGSNRDMEHARVPSQGISFSVVLRAVTDKSTRHTRVICKSSWVRCPSTPLHRQINIPRQVSLV